MGILQKLTQIQTELKAPKDQFNDFGKYHYRSTEGIFKELKPFLTKYNVSLTMSDDLQGVGDRAFIKAVATLKDLDVITDGKTFREQENNSVTVQAFAEIDTSHKGMTADQATGCASSYARKYALNALFLLDDTKDSDTNENRIAGENKSVDAKTLAVLKDEIKRTGTDEKKILAHYQAEDLAKLSKADALEAINTMKKKESKKDGN